MRARREQEHELRFQVSTKCSEDANSPVHLKEMSAGEWLEIRLGM